MSEWKEYELQEVVSIIKDVYTPTKGDNKTYIGLEHIQQHSLRLDSIGTSESVTSQKFSFRSSDILFGKLRPYFRKVVNPDFDGVCSTDIWVIRAKENHNQKFVRYLVSTYEFIETCNIGESGTRMPRADWNHLKSTKWLLPEYDEQERIAEVLSSLDDKIDLLHRQNQTLEQLAETMFKKWFVEEAEDSWEEVKLEDLCEIISSGGTPSTKKSEYYGGDVNWYSTKELNDNFLFESVSKITGQGLQNSSAKLFPIGTVVIAIYAAPTVGRLGILATEAAFNQAACGLVADQKKCSKEFLYLFLKSQREELNQLATGSAQQNLNVGKIKTYPLLIPPKAVFDKLKSFAEPIFQKIQKNTRQVKQLEQTRDTLLPKLMSGAVRVISS